MKVVSSTFSDGIEVDHYCNEGAWLDYGGELWLLGIGAGFDTIFVLIEAQNEQDAMDEYADSEFAYLTEVSEEDHREMPDDELEWHSFLGNDCKLHREEDFRILERCTIVEGA